MFWTLSLCVWQGSSKARTQRGSSVGSDSGSSTCTGRSSLDQPSLDDSALSVSAQLRPTSPLR